MLFRHRFYVAALVAGMSWDCVADAQVTPVTPTPYSAPQITEETRDGVKYQVTRQVVQQTMPVTIMQDRQQTVYTQQVVNETIPHQQVYTVPVTQYEMVSTLHGRWNPFVEPYYTYEMQPVTYYQEQVASVQIPMSKVTWVPQTKTVQVPVTEYRTAEQEIVTRVALSGGELGKTYASTQSSEQRAVTMQPYNSQPASSLASQSPSGYPTAATPLPTYATTQPTYGYGQPPYNSMPVTPTPAASIATRPTGQSVSGGQMLQNDPPKQGTGWSNLRNSGYR